MKFTNHIRKLVKKNPNLKLKLKKANSKLSSFQYIYQTISMTIFSFVFLSIIVFLFTKSNLYNTLIGIFVCICLIPFFYNFWFGLVDVQINKLAREIDSDLLFVSEYFLVSLESGLPLGNAIEGLSKLKRPGGIFFKRIYTEFKVGKNFEEALDEGSNFSASENMKILLKRLKDSISIGVDLKLILKNFIEESSEKKLLEIKTFSKKLNPVIMMYLLLGIVLPSLGTTFFILGAAMINMTPNLLKYVLIFIFLLMFGFQYISYSMFKFSKSTL